MSRGMVVAVAIACLCAGGAVQCFLKASELRSEARWLLARGNAQADQYAATFDGTVADSQLSTFAQRRAVLERADRWQRLQLVLVLATAIAAFCSYVLYLFRRLREQLVEGTLPADLPERLSSPGPTQTLAAVPVRAK